MLTWRSGDYITAQVILEVANTGPTWIEFDAFRSDFAVFAPDGSVTETDSFDHEAPKWLAPGATGYVVGEVFTEDFPRSDVDRVEADGRYSDSDPPEKPLSVENTRLRRASFGDGVEATGQVLNEGSMAVENATVVAVLSDASGEILGYASGYVENVALADIPLADVADALFFASDWGF